VGYVLIIDDNQDFRSPLQHLLREEGYSVSTASNGQEALAFLRNHPLPCLILLDLMMPVMNGWEFRNEQLKDSQLSSVPTVLLTGMLSLEEVSDTLHPAGYISKAAPYETILETVQRYCH
jgi:CheY-like chemotaxis protein